MTSRDRNARGQGDRLRRELLDAAVAIMAAPRPVEAPGLRAVARAAGVAPSAVYLHFESGQALAAAVVEDLFDDLRRELEAADDDGAAPADRLRAAAHALAAWARRRPGAYQVLFETPDLTAPDAGPGLDLLARVAELLGLAGGRTPEEAAPLAQRVWAALHGIVSLRLHKPHAPWAGELDDDVDAVLDALLA